MIFTLFTKKKEEKRRQTQYLIVLQSCHIAPAMFLSTPYVSLQQILLAASRFPNTWACTPIVIMLIDSLNGMKMLKSKLHACFITRASKHVQHERGCIGMPLHG